MADLQVFKVVDLMPAHPVEDGMVGGERQIRLKVRGDAGLTSEVQVNGLLVTSFLALSPHYLTVLLPPSLREYSLTDLQFVVLSSERTDHRELYEIRYGIGRRTAPISGQDVLLQRWLRFLLMSPGSDPLDRSAGCGLMEISGRITGSNLDDARATVARLHKECARQIIQRQELSHRRIPPAEQLVDARLMSIGFDDNYRLVLSSQLIDGRLQQASTQVRV
jgi:hypothetical protein